MSDRAERLIELMKMAVDNPGCDKLWEEMFKNIQVDPIAFNVWNVASSQGWGREKFATVLALVLLDNSAHLRQQILDMYHAVSPKPIAVRKMVKTAVPEGSPEVPRHKSDTASDPAL